MGIIALLLGGVFSFFASGHPDGLEKVAEDKGFIGNALEYPFATVMPDYAFPVENEFAAAMLAGLIGTIFVFILIYSFFRLFSIKK